MTPATGKRKMCFLWNNTLPTEPLHSKRWKESPKPDLRSQSNLTHTSSSPGLSLLSGELKGVPQAALHSYHGQASVLAKDICCMVLKQTQSWPLPSITCSLIQRREANATGHLQAHAAARWQGPEDHEQLRGGNYWVPWRKNLRRDSKQEIGGGEHSDGEGQRSKTKLLVGTKAVLATLRSLNFKQW